MVFFLVFLKMAVFILNKELLNKTVFQPSNVKYSMNKCHVLTDLRLKSDIDMV